MFRYTPNENLLLDYTRRDEAYANAEDNVAKNRTHANSMIRDNAWRSRQALLLETVARITGDAGYKDRVREAGGSPCYIYSAEDYFHTCYYSTTKRDTVPVRGILISAVWFDCVQV